LKRLPLISVEVFMNDSSIKYAVLGDVHANLEALEAVLHDASDQGCTHFACVGDIVGYNANPKECLDIIRGMGMPCVKGNHDEYASTDDAMENLNPRAVSAIHWTRPQLPEADKQWLRDLKYVRHVANFSVVHATLDAPQRWGYVFHKLDAAASFTYQNTSVCFFGHTHLPMTFVRDTAIHGGIYSKFRIEPDRKYFVNVGSVGEPRDGNPLAAYVTYDLADGLIELRRVAYDAAMTQAKVRAAGLTPRWKP
jgi:diadenosine tetraphosphatase ApaH/serine/threonine PP2A family protein phosphatase